MILDDCGAGRCRDARSPGALDRVDARVGALKEGPTLDVGRKIPGLLRASAAACHSLKHPSKGGARGDRIGLGLVRYAIWSARSQAGRRVRVRVAPAGEG